MSENPGVENIENLLKKVDSGTYVIPYFQRGFEWDPSMVCDLFESILQNYYCGLLLLWELDAESAKREKWDPIWGAKLKESPPEKAILDGQQRLASLYFAINNPKKRFPKRYSYYTFYINLNKILNQEYEGSVTYSYSSNYRDFKKLNKNKSWKEDGIVPLSILSEKDPINPAKKYIDSKEFDEHLNFYFDKYKDKLPNGLTIHNIYQVFNGILNYSFVFYPLSKERELPDICNIFAKVNAKGMRLSTFDLMNAFLYPKGVKLRKELWENMNYSKLKNADSRMNEYLLKQMSLVKQSYCSSKFIYNLIPGEKTGRKDEKGKTYEDILIKDGKDFTKLWERSCLYAEKARKCIMNTGFSDFGAIKESFIPNTTIIPVLGAILSIYDTSSLEKDFKEKIKKWYWAAVLSGEYSGSSDTIMAEDYRDLKNWIENKGNIRRIKNLNRQFIEDLDLLSARRGSALYNAILCLLALSDSRDFFKGQIVGVGDYANEKINDHHIFPKKISRAKIKKSDKFNTYKDFILNRTLLLDETNIRIRNKRPSLYLKEVINHIGSEEDTKKLMKTHFIDSEAYNYLKENDFDNFIEAREKSMKQHIIEKLGL